MKSHPFIGEKQKGTEKYEDEKINFNSSFLIRINDLWSEGQLF